MVAVGAMVLLTIRRLAFRNRWFSALRPALFLITPPRDLYDCLVELPFDRVLDLDNATFEFRHKYAGAHQIGVITQRRVEHIFDHPVPKLRILMHCRVGDKQVFSAILGENASPWWKAGQSGFAFLRYEVPTDLPLETPIECQLRVPESGEDFTARYGALRMYVRKASEE